MKPHIAVIDPAVKRAELISFNNLVGISSLPLTYHLPVLQGMESLEREEDRLAGIILFGSLSSVNERLPWQETLEKWLMKRLESKTPAFGCCYGHQMIAHMFGGKINYRTPDHHKLVGFRDVEVLQNPLWGKSQTGPLYVSHNEIVTKVPEDFEIIAKSSDVLIDGLAHKSLPIWTFQPHPEATPYFAEVRGTTDVKPDTFNFGYTLLKCFIDFCAKRK